MFPIRDQNPISCTPYVTFALIVFNCFVFLFEVTRPGDEMSRFTWKYGFVPAELVRSPQEFREHMRRDPPRKPVVDRHGRVRRVRLPGGRVGELSQPAPEYARAAVSLPAWINVFTCMFLHGGWMHLLGNMLFLWIFGNNIEDRLGPLLFLVFYIGTGLVGNLAHTVRDPSFGPLVGASGAISGVMGAYILLFPRARILAIVPIGWYPATVSLPAWIYLGIYILLQNIWPAYFGGGASNVAYMAHIGGFLSGMALIHIFPRRKGAAPRGPVYDRAKDDADFVV